MESFAISVKAFIVNEKKELLLIKRRKKDVHYPDIWEIPGGRLDSGENPFIGLKREAKEETNLDIEILNPLGVAHFMRDDGQKITLIGFLCKNLTDDVILSEEHTEYKWVAIEGAENYIHKKFYYLLDSYKKHFYK